MDSSVQSLHMTYNMIDDKLKKDFMSYVKDNYDEDTYGLFIRFIESDEYLDSIK